MVLFHGVIVFIAFATVVLTAGRAGATFTTVELATLDVEEAVGAGETILGDLFSNARKYKTNTTKKKQKMKIKKLRTRLTCVELTGIKSILRHFSTAGN